MIKLVREDCKAGGQAPDGEGADVEGRGLFHAKTPTFEISGTLFPTVPLFVPLLLYYFLSVNRKSGTIYLYFQKYIYTRARARARARACIRFAVPTVPPCRFL